VVPRTHKRGATKVTREKAGGETAMGYTVAVAGATGAVGTEMILELEQFNFPVDELRLLASARSVGKTSGGSTSSIWPRSAWPCGVTDSDTCQPSVPGGQ